MNEQKYGIETTIRMLNIDAKVKLLYVCYQKLTVTSTVFIWKKALRFNGR